MKPYKVLLFAIALLTASTAFAQFNTVSHDTPRYKVSVKSATQPTPRLPDASAPSATPYSDSLQTSQQKKRIDQRQGVAYPLKHIQVTSPFGYRHDPFTGKKRMHNGLDLHARSDKVFAMLHGIVHKVGYDKCFGIFVTLRHGDITVSYCHLSKVTVRNRCWDYWEYRAQHRWTLAHHLQAEGEACGSDNDVTFLWSLSEVKKSTNPILLR